MHTRQIWTSLHIHIYNPFHNFPYPHENDEQFTDPVEIVKTDHSMQMHRLISLFVPGPFSHETSLIEASTPESCTLMLFFDLNSDIFMV